jgi:hypothetical protein
MPDGMKGHREDVHTRSRTEQYQRHVGPRITTTKQHINRHGVGG